MPPLDLNRLTSGHGPLTGDSTHRYQIAWRQQNDGCFLHLACIRLLRNRARLYQSLRPAEKEILMIETILLLAISAALLVYLVYALLRPEKF